MLSSDRIRGPTRFGKALNLIFPRLSSQNKRGCGHATILKRPAATEKTYNVTIFSFQVCLRDIFFNHLMSPSKGELIPKAPKV